jgi:hypothetical protein
MQEITIGNRRYQLAQPYIYTPNPVVLSMTDANPTVAGQIQLQNDADFELISIQQVTDIAGALQTDSTRILPLATIILQQSGTGNDIMPQPVPIPSIAGDGRLPYLLPETWIWPGGGNISINLARYAVAGTNYNVRLSFHGRKLYGRTQ